MDGVTVGHPRCNVEHCTNELRSSRDRFCALHWGQRDLCAIRECGLQSSLGFWTCAHTKHRSVELRRREQGKAIFRLKARLAKASGTTEPREPLSEVEYVDETMEDSELGHDCLSALDPISGNSATEPQQSHVHDTQTVGRQKTRTSLSQRWTHNEQLIVQCCGVILSRATFFEAESPSNAVVSRLHFAY